MANLEDRKPHSEQSDEEKRVEQEEVNSFNQNTNYDDRSSLHTEDPFSDHNLRIQTLITNMRIYDALLTLIRLQGDEGAAAVRDLLELHAAGHILSTAPGFSGTFLTDEMNGPDLTDNQGDDDEESADS